VPLSYDARSVFSLFSMKYMGSCPLNRKKVFSCGSFDIIRDSRRWLIIAGQE
jgi:hypothetical protein